MKKQSGKKGKIQKTNQTKIPSETKHPKAKRKKKHTKKTPKKSKRHGMCGAENRGLKGRRAVTSPGRCPPPAAEHRVWPPHPALENPGCGLEVATEVRSSQKKHLRGKPAQPHFSGTTCPWLRAGRTALVSDTLSTQQGHSSRPQSLTENLSRQRRES